MSGKGQREPLIAADGGETRAALTISARGGGAGAGASLGSGGSTPSGVALGVTAGNKEDEEVRPAARAARGGISFPRGQPPP